MIDTITLFGKSVSLYYTFWFLGMVGSLIYGYMARKEYGISFARSTIYVSLDLIFGYFLIWITSWVFGGGKVNGFNFVRIPCFIPLYFILLARMMGDPLWVVSDYLAPIGGFFFGITHFGCFFEGCCHGYPSGYGFFSNVARAYCFPIQLVEAVNGLLIGTILFVMVKRKIQQKCLYPWFMVLFGGTRFIFEFFRDNDKLFWNISELALHALAAFILGTAAIIVINLQKKRSVQYE